jgi:LDH2 family malate/lactate/ureidoglycolate dehydrogenase
MSTSAVAGGKLEWAIREHRAIPAGWGVTAAGEHTTDPAQVLPAGGGLLPLGGSEEHSSYKGYGLALMVEVLTGVLAGGPTTRGVGALTSSVPVHAAGVSHVFVALDARRFGMDDLPARVAALCGELRELTPVDPERPVLVPGDPEEAMLRVRTRDGIPIASEVEAPLAALADRTGIPLPRKEPAGAQSA